MQGQAHLRSSQSAGIEPGRLLPYVRLHEPEISLQDLPDRQWNADGRVSHFLYWFWDGASGDRVGLNCVFAASAEGLSSLEKKIKK
jgi:hypothetical protein